MIGRLLMCSAMLLASPIAQAADMSPSLSSPMINRHIYRDGEVRRSNGRFGAWFVTCDEIVSLKQRFCSLRSSALRGDNRQAAYVDLSTGDNGKPAALVHLPLGVSVSYGVDIEASAPSSDGAVKTARSADAATRKLGIVSCSTSECLAVWSLSPTDIRALSNAGQIRLTLCGPDPDRLAASADPTSGSCEVKSAGVLSALGFKDAIHAATL